MIRTLKMQPRLMAAALIGVAAMFVLPQDWRHATRSLVAWDICVGLYLLLIGVMMYGSDEKTIRKRASSQDAGQFLVLLFTTVAALASLAAIVGELGVAKELHGQDKWPHIALAALTVLLSWSFMHAIFALHYAHEFYGEGESGKAAQGLEFPACKNPNYWDFIYYSFIIGTACATADVMVTSKMIRKLTTIHCVVAFFFNTTILALTVNIGASLF